MEEEDPVRPAAAAESATSSAVLPPREGGGEGEGRGAWSSTEELLSIMCLHSVLCLV